MKEFNKALEIGAGDSFSSELLYESSRIWEAHLFEPNPILYRDLDKAAQSIPNVKTYSAAVSNRNSVGKLRLLGYASFLSGAPSFMNLSVEPDSEHFWDAISIEVPTVNIREIDKGDIDLLILTAQGSDFIILQNLISRPRVISTKFYVHNEKQGTEVSKIIKWLRDNKYKGQLLDKSQYGTYYHMEFSL